MLFRSLFTKEIADRFPSGGTDYGPAKGGGVWEGEERRERREGGKSLIYYFSNSANLAAFQPDLDAMGVK